MADAFDPDEFLRAREAARAKKAQAFDPDAFLKARAAAREQPDAPPPQDPTDQLFVSREAATETRPFGERAASVGQNWGEGGLLAGDSATFGLANRGIAYARARADNLMGGAATYDQKVTEQAAYLQKLREADKDRAVMAELLGGVGGGAGLAKAGITLAKPGVGWLSRALLGGVEGAAQGAAQAAGQNYGSFESKLASMAPGAVLGGTFGTALPLAVSGGAGAKTLFDITRGNIPKYPPSLLRAVEADRAGVPGGHVGVEDLPNLGPEAMLVDAGPSMLRVGAAAKTTPGTGSTALESGLRVREKGTIPRLERGVDESFGPDVIPKHVERDIEVARKAIGPEWEAAFDNAKAVNAAPVADWVERQIIDKRGAAQNALQEVRNALNIKGTDQLDPHPRTLHEVRMMIDGMRAKADIDPKAATALKQARDRISEELHAKVPGMADLDARYAEIMSRGKAFERGQELFDTGRNQVVRPAEWIDEKAAMALPVGGPRATPVPSQAPKYSEMGTRAELGRVVGTGADDLGILERKFGPHNWATQNLATQFGVKSVEDFQHMLRTNRTFRESYNKIVHGSKTADTIEAAADSTRGYDAMLRYATRPVEMVGDALERAQQGFGAGVRNRIAEVLATRGPHLDELRRDLLKASGEQARNDLTRTMLESVARRSVAGTVPRANR